MLYQERFSLIAKGRDFVLSLLILLLGWQCIIWLTGVPRYILPPPLLVAQTFIDHAALIYKHGKVTAIEVVAGLGIGLVLGLATALSVMYYATARRLMMPALVLTQVIPVFALAPLLTLWLGYGLASKIAMALLIIYFPITSSFLDGLKSTPPGYIDLAKTMQVSDRNLLLKIAVPAAIPSLTSGLRLAAVYAPIGAVIGEWVGSSNGLGYLMLLANGRVKTALMFATLVALCIFTILLRSVVGALCDRMDRWATGQS